MPVFRQYLIPCHCGHRNVLDPSPRRNVRKMMARAIFACRGCGTELDTAAYPPLPATKMILEVRQELIAAGITPVC